MGDRYGRSDTNELSIGISIWNMGYQCWTWYIDMVSYHIDMVGNRYGIWADDMGDGVSIWSSLISIWPGYSVTLMHGRPCQAPPTRVTHRR